MLCRSCGADHIKKVLKLGNLYLSDFIDIQKTAPTYPLTLLLCRSCKLVQLEKSVANEKLYTDRYGYRSGINNTIREDLQDIAKKASVYFKKSKRKLTVVDIGANDGTLLGFYPDSYFKIAFEPVKKLAKDCAKKASVVINDYFNYKSYQKAVGDQKAQIITAISCFYDIEDPNKFIMDTKKILDKKGIFIIQQNYLVAMLKNNAYDNIVHEHIEYYSLLSLEHLLKRHGMEIFDVELNEINGGSFRTYICYTDQYPQSSRVAKLRAEEAKLKLGTDAIYENFAKRVVTNSRKLKTFIKEALKKGKTIYVYGASTRGNTILQYTKLDNRHIQKAVERNKEKWGKTFGVNAIPIISEEEARKKQPDYMLVLPWFFEKEFIKREEIYLKNGGTFLFPLPKFHITKYSG